MTCSKSQALTPESKISTPEEIHKIKESLQQKACHYDNLDMSWWRCGFHDSVRLNTANVSIDSDRTIPDAVLRKIPPTANHIIYGVMNELNMFAKFGSLNMYNIFSCINPSAGPKLADGTIIFFASLKPWISTVLQNLTTKSICGSSRQK